MKILFFVHQLDVGGTEVNSIELAAALRDLHGFDVVFFSTPGPTLKLVEEKGLRFLPAPVTRHNPSLARMRALREAVRSEHPDIIHVWEGAGVWACIDAYYGVHLPRRVPMVLTDMSMWMTRLLPKQLPVTFGTPELVERARRSGRARVELLLPGVDVHLNAPGAVDPGTFCKKYCISSRDITLVTVSRLAGPMKGESLFRTIDAVRRLGRDFPLRFLLVGDGPLREPLLRLADEVNAELRRPAVALTGALLDPRPAYAAADVVIGMGGSALRGMAFAKPVVIVGEKGFSATLTPETATSFYNRGMYGVGDGTPGNGQLIAEIRKLAELPNHCSALGQFSREFVQQHFSLESVAARFAAFCSTPVVELPPLHLAAVDGLRTAVLYARRRFLAALAAATSLQSPGSPVYGPQVAQVSPQQH
jgi:glycosyltransferase involved in cell wall biosynthesis